MMEASHATEVARVLVVDDHRENLLALTAILGGADYQVVTVDSGGDALKKVLKHEFAVVLLDVFMPGMDGIETARLIRSRQASRNLPIIFLTATAADVRLVQEGYSVGAVDYLIKPLAPEIVRAKVGVFVELFRKTVQLQKQQQKLHEAERKRDAAALKESEAQYEAIYKEAPVGIGHAAPDGKWLQANRRFSEILGYSEEELQELRFQDIAYQEELPEAVGVMHQLLAGERDWYRGEHRFVHKNGGIVWANVTVSLIRSAQGGPRSFVAVLEDVTERRREEERRQFLTRASASLLASMDHQMVLQDVAGLAVSGLADLCFIEVSLDGQSPTTSVVRGSSPELQTDAETFRRRAGHDLGIAIKPDYRPDGSLLLSDLSLDRVAEAVPDLQAREIGRRINVQSLVVTSIRSRSGVLGSVVFVSTTPGRHFNHADLSLAEDLGHRIGLAVDNAALYQQAQHAISARDEFLSVASHELRTPLTPLLLSFQRLIGTSESLERLPQDKLKITLQRAHTQIRRLAGLIESLLDVSRIKSGLLELYPETCDLSELSRDLVSRFAEVAARANVTLSLEAEDAVQGRWDKGRIEQLLTNLIDNSIKYGAGKPVFVEVKAQGPTAVFRIRDTGIGIAPEKIDRIFDRFERAVPTRSYGGLGLGLYISRQIVQAHNGTIRVTSHLGQGAEFVVELPRVAAEQMDTAEGLARSPEVLQTAHAVAH